VLFASLVDDPSSHPDRFPTEADQEVERQRLFALIEKMVPWEATADETIMRAAREEIRASCGGDPPPVLDPFSGGGSIPLEGQRLGLDVRASDLNPVAVLIAKALVELPPRFAGRPPAHPDADVRRGRGWKRAEGLAEDVRRYGAWMHEEARQRIGHLYPDATLPDGTKAPVIAWLWARTVSSPNPAANGAHVPLVSRVKNTLLNLAPSPFPSYSLAKEIYDEQRWPTQSPRYVDR
jgi:putative DNA methylase